MQALNTDMPRQRQSPDQFDTFLVTGIQRSRDRIRSSMVSYAKHHFGFTMTHARLQSIAMDKTSERGRMFEILDFHRISMGRHLSVAKGEDYSLKQLLSIQIQREDEAAGMAGVGL